MKGLGAGTAAAAALVALAVCGVRALQPPSQAGVGIGSGRPKQVISVRCKDTNVVLVGSMHYSPKSIRQSAATVQELGEQGLLGAVCLESCTSRWEKTCKSQPRGSNMARYLLPNEMQSAAFVADDFRVPVLLVDQNITVTTQRMKETLRESVSDLASLNFDRLFRDVQAAGQMVFQSDARITNGENKGNSRQQRLEIQDFLDPSLMLLTPVSLFRYPLAILLKNTKVGLSVLALLVATSVLAQSELTSQIWNGVLHPGGDIDGFAAGHGGDEEVLEPVVARAVDVAATAATVVVEAMLLARTFVVALLAERNAVLAENIREACRRVSGGKTVVAVLGAAHVNGVAALLSAGDDEYSNSDRQR